MVVILFVFVMLFLLLIWVCDCIRYRLVLFGSIFEVELVCKMEGFWVNLKEE